jgi:hypothetical protein
VTDGAAAFGSRALSPERYCKSTVAASGMHPLVCELPAGHEGVHREQSWWPDVSADRPVDPADALRDQSAARGDALLRLHAAVEELVAERGGLKERLVQEQRARGRLESERDGLREANESLHARRVELEAIVERLRSGKGGAPEPSSDGTPAPDLAGAVVRAADELRWALANLLGGG